MSEAAEKLKAVLLELPAAERLELADFLYESIAPPPGPVTAGTPEFDALLARRLDELEGGRVAGIPAEETMNRLRDKYAK